MAEKSTVRAAYNFVSFSAKKPLVRYASVEELPHQDELTPELKTGEIHVEMVADTPVFISDGNKEDPHFFRNAEGKPCIPGSSVRGMVRTNMQILGFGLMRSEEELEDRQIYFREMTAAAGSTGDALKSHYKAALNIKTMRNEEGKSFSIPENVSAGYLFCEGNRYYIRPSQGNYLRISRKHRDMAAFGDAPARTVAVAYTAAENRIKTIVPAEQAQAGMKFGKLLFTGKPVGRDANHLYVFPEADSEADPVEISKEDQLSYQADWEERKNSLKAYYDPDFWKLPQPGEEKPVFYARHEGHTYFGMSLFLRIGHRYPLSKGLPKAYQELLVQEREGERVLDYPSAILGYADRNGTYRSRVAFEDFAAIGPVTEENPFKIILGQPKPSYYPGYAVDGKNYCEEEFQLRGYKQYWLKEAERPAVLKEKVATTLRPLPKGTRFKGVIRYRNLTEDELGLLLWSLRLDEGCYQSIGMARPYGYGRMKLNITALYQTDLGKLYALDSLAGGIEKTAAEAVDRYIDMYDAYAANQMYIKKPKKKPSLRSLSEIQDFFYIHSTIMEGNQVGYMELEEFKNLTPLPTIKDFREAEPKEAEKPAAAADPYAELLAKWGKKH